MKHFYRSFLLVFCTVSIFCVSELKAQDPRFAQFYAAPLHLNPAMTGVFEGKFRAAVNYREQWASILDKDPYRTIGASFDARWHIAGDDYIAGGISMLKDQAGLSSFDQTQFNLTVSYMKQLNGNRYNSSQQYLILGAQAGAGQHSVNSQGLWFSDQFNSDIYQPTPLSIESRDIQYDANGQPVGNLSSNFFMDASAGLMWYALLDDNLSIYAGGSVHHLNGPTVDLFEGGDNNETKEMRWSGHFGGEIPFSSEFSILPAVNIMFQGPSYSTTLGTNVRYSNHDWNELAIRAGGWLHLSNGADKALNTDAFILAAMLEIERIILGVSYDINVSDLTQATNFRGGYELSLIYSHPSKERYSVKCPNF